MKKLNRIDLLALVFLALVALVPAIGFFQKTAEPQNKVLLTVKVTENGPEVITEAKKEIGKTVYLNGIAKTATLIGFVTKEGQYFLMVSARGELKNPIYIVFGKRIVVGQKAEVRGGFLAKGIITEIKNDNQK